MRKTIFPTKSGLRHWRHRSSSHRADHRVRLLHGYRHGAAARRRAARPRANGWHKLRHGNSGLDLGITKCIGIGMAGWVAKKKDLSRTSAGQLHDHCEVQLQLVQGHAKPHCLNMFEHICKVQQTFSLKGTGVTPTTYLLTSDPPPP